MLESLLGGQTGRLADFRGVGAALILPGNSRRLLRVFIHVFVRPATARADNQNFVPWRSNQEPMIVLFGANWENMEEESIIEFKDCFKCWQIQISRNDAESD